MLSVPNKILVLLEKKIILNIKEIKKSDGLPESNGSNSPGCSHVTLGIFKIISSLVTTLLRRVAR